MNPTRLPELLLPAGGFAAGLAAFEGGADAIYLGFADFSARRQARNFTREEYRRILGFARERGGKVYVTLNTILLESEFPAATALLAFLGRFPPDALIIQDWGLASHVRTSFPGIPLHASTQTAIQTPAAARLAAEAGTSRVVLPRESSTLDLARFVAEAPGLEFEVFVHGALCYSFSGLCLASGSLLGRSGNRGECAQVCRSFYDSAELGGRGYWFSCKDLSLVDRLAELAAAGAASLKVEGRMKSPEYVHAVASLYRGALDRLSGGGPDEAEMGARRKAARLAFSRAPTPGWSAHHGGGDLLDPSFPGHRGIPLGMVVGSRRSAAGPLLEVELEEELGLRDGIQALLDREGEGQEGRRPPEAIAFPAAEIRDARNGRELLRARPGSRLLLAAPRLLPVGTALSRISSRALDRREPSPAEYPAMTSSLPARIGLGEGGRLRLAVEMPRFDGLAGAGATLELEDEEGLPFTPASSPGGFLRARTLFAEAGERDYHLLPQVDADARLPGGAGELALADLFVPPSLLKKAKNRLYARLDAELERAERAAAEAALALLPATGQTPEAGALAAAFPGLPPRGLLSFERAGLPGGMPFATGRILEEGLPLPLWADHVWLPLAPVARDNDGYADLVLRRVEAELAAGRRLMVGLGGIHHAVIARRIHELHGGGGLAGSYAFFADIHCYIANTAALAAWSRMVPRLIAAYAWLEAGEAERQALLDAARGSGNTGVFEAGKGWNVPLFISRGCLLRHGPGKGHCPSPCGKRWTARLRDRERDYLAVVEDCVTWLFRTEESPR